MLRFFLLIWIFIGLLSSASAQLLNEPFNANLTGNGWVPNGANLSWTPDGTAAAIPGADWRNRSPIRSASRGGAAVFTGSGNGTTLLSPQFDAAGTELFLTFYHYFRSAGGTIQVRVLGNGGVELLRTTVVPNLGQGQETSSGKFEIIDLSAVLPLPQPFQLEFSVVGESFFWLVDDISLWDSQQTYPTFPRYVGENLTAFGVPFITDSLGAAAVPFQLVVDFNDAATPAIQQDILDQLGAVRKETCVCDRIELWELPGGIFFDPVSGAPLGDPGEILEGTLGSNSSGNVDNIELNLLNYQELQNVPVVPNAPLQETQIAGLLPAPADAVKIAVLDSGVDLDHPDLVNYFYRNDDDLGNNTDDDGNCYPDDVIGWNFVDGNNNPSDDHSHGSHVAGIIAQNLEACPDCPFQIIPYKTHDSYGVGTLFATACATLQASVMDGADVINASWGFYGGGSDILKGAIDTAGNYGALVVAAAGNDSLNLVADQQHPATFVLPEVIAVGTFQENGGAFSRADFSNYNPVFVDIFAEGIAIISTVPDNDTGIKTGTSMSTPAVAAGAALHVCGNGANPAVTKNFILANAEKRPSELGDFVLDGNLLDLTVICDQDADFTGFQPVNSSFSIYLSEDGQTVSIQALQPINGLSVEILSKTGLMLFQQTNIELADGEPLNVDLSSSSVAEYLVVLRFGGRTLVQRLAQP